MPLFKNRTQKGLSLIELLVSMVLGLIIISGTTKSLLSFSKSSKLSNLNLGMQETANLALDYIESQIKNSLSTPCEKISAIPASQFKFLKLKGESSGENIKNDTQDNELRATLRGLGFSIEQESSNVKIGNVTNPTSDNITFISAYDRNFLLSDYNQKSDNFSISASFSEINKTKSLFLVTDCKKMAIFRAKTAKGNEETTITPMDFSEQNEQEINIGQPYSTSESAMIAPLNVLQISTKDHQLYNGLKYGDKTPVLENVELMRLLFGIDNNKDGLIDSYVTASQLNPLNTSVVSVDIFLMVRAKNGETFGESVDETTVSIPDTSAAIEKKIKMQEFKLTDRIIRKVYRRTVVIRSDAVL